MNFRFSLLFIFAASLVTLTGCKKQPTQQKMLDEIEHFNIDTIVAKPVDTANMDRADSCRYRADNVLRKYPEMYHATDNVQKAYDKWVERERDFIIKVFAGKDSKKLKTLAQNETKLSQRLQQLNFIEPLTLIIIDGADPQSSSQIQLTSVPDDKAITECYRKPMFAIRDGIQDNKNEYSTDEMRSACEKARRAWLDYIAATNGLLKTMPEECRTPMQQAIRNIICLHAIDLHNCYMQYWTSSKPGYLLRDSCTDSEYAASTYEPLMQCPWMEVNIKN